MESTGRRIHALEEKARESGNPLEALKYSDEAMLAYQKEGDTLGFAEILSARVITLRHLNQETGDNNYLILAKHTAQASVDIARESGDKSSLVLPLLNLGNVQEKLGEIDEAVKNFKESVELMESNPPQLHNRPSVLANLKVHLTTCEYKTGDKSALERAEQALLELEQSEEPTKYNKDVWLSGAHMRIAAMLKSDNPVKAKEHLQKAREIIDRNQELTIRKKQWEKLSASFV